LTNRKSMNIVAYILPHIFICIMNQIRNHSRLVSQMAFIYVQFKAKAHK